MKTPLRSWLICSVATLGVFASPAASRSQVGDEVVATVVSDSAGTIADTTTIVFRVHVDTSSTTALFAVYLDAPAGAEATPPVGDETDWYTGSTWRGLQRAFWASLELTTPGGDTGGLTLRALGYPGVVDSWVRGDFALLAVAESDTAASPQYPDLWTEGSVEGKTLGIVAIPTDTTAAGLLDRLEGLASDACGTLAWISDSSVCTAIATDIDQAEAAVDALDPTTANTELAGILATLSAALSSGDTNTLGYWLLRSNVEIIQAKL